MTPRPAAVLFDLDGLLVDSEPLWTVAEREIAARLGGEFRPDIKAAMIGQPLPVAVPILLKGLDTEASRRADPNEIGDFLLSRIVELFHDELPVQPGARDLLDAVADAGLPTALVSSSYRVVMEAALDTLGRHHFTVTIAGDEVPAGKPAPDPYLQAAEHLGQRPPCCVVLEDSLAGVRSAVAAGCACVMVPTFHPDDLPNGVVIRRNLGEVDLDLLGSLVPAS